jgi:hypothetical protein
MGTRFMLILAALLLLLTIPAVLIWSAVDGPDCDPSCSFGQTSSPTSW